MVNSFQIECLESKNTLPGSKYSKFSLGPLEPGQGITIGNSLRRVLLSELKASAITSARISGIQHEFSVLKGVREDVLEILLNLKEITFEGLVSSPSSAFLKVKGPRVITAQDIQLPIDLKVVNPNQYIATLLTSGALEMELKIETGKGYNLVENASLNVIDALEIDAIFMPVRKVSYEIQLVNIPENKTNEYLILEITTDGSITPEESLTQASQHLIKLLQPLTSSDIVTSSSQISNLNNIELEDLNLSVRCYNCLKRAEINSLFDLLEYPRDQLKDLKNLGQKSLQEIEELLETYSSTLSEKES